MKQFTLAAFAAVLMTGAAYAGSLHDRSANSTKDLPAPAIASQSSVNWSGPYIGGALGYGIYQSEGTIYSTEKFPAAPSLCWTKGSIDGTAPYKFDPGTPSDVSDDKPIDFGADGGASITDITEEQCKSFLGGSYPSGSGGNPPNSNGVGDVSYEYSSGYTPAKDAYSVTTPTHFERSENGFVGSVRLGYDHASDRFLVGVLGDYAWSGADGIDGSWLVGGRIGFLLMPRVLAYGLVGYGQTQAEHADFSGVVAGGGLEVALGGNMFAGLEYLHSFYDGESYGLGPNVSVTEELTEDKIMATLKIKLNGGVLPRLDD